MKDGDKLVMRLRGEEFLSGVWEEYKRDWIYWMDYVMGGLN